MNTFVRALAGALTAAALLLPVTAHAQPGPAATASAITTSEDSGTEAFVDLTFTGDGEFPISANQLRITTAGGKTLAVAHRLTQRDPETNLRLREITAPETIGSGETVSLRFEFSGVDDLDEASNLSVLTDAAGTPVASWRVR